MTNQIKVGIIGAGQIGANQYGAFLSHAGAITAHQQTRLVGFYDVNQAVSQQAADVWQTEVFGSFDDLMEKGRPEVIVICSPDMYHIEQIQKAMAYPLEAIIVEKPIMYQPGDDRLIQPLMSSSIPVLVNYSRRYLPCYHELKQVLEQQIVRAVTIYYAKGFRHNAVHAIDLIRMWFGEVQHYQITHSHMDYQETDLSLSLALQTTQTKNINLIALDDRDFTLFEVDIFTNQQRFRILNDHQTLAIYTVQDNQGFPPGKRLVHAADQLTDHAKATYYLIDEMIALLQGQPNSAYLWQEAFRTEQLVEQISLEASQMDVAEVATSAS